MLQEALTEVVRSAGAETDDEEDFTIDDLEESYEDDE